MKRHYKNQNLNNAELHKKSIAGYIELVMREVLDVVVSLYIMAILFVLPFYYTQGYAHIGSDKAVFFKNCSKVSIGIFIFILLYFLVLVIEKLFVGGVIKGLFSAEFRWEVLVKWFRDSFSVTDIFAFLFIFSVIVSYLCSDYREVALWGQERWFMGLMPQLTLVSLYFFISRFWRVKKGIIVLVLPVTFVVFVLGILNRFGVYPIDMEISNSSFISTIGNINWYCAYMVTVLFAVVAFYIFWNVPVFFERSSEIFSLKVLLYKLVFLIYILVGFVTLVTNGSDSGIFTFVAIMVYMFLKIGLKSKSEKLYQQMLNFSFVMCVMGFVCFSVYIFMQMFDIKFDADYLGFEFLTKPQVSMLFFIVSNLFLMLVLYIIRVEYGRNSIFKGISNKPNGVFARYNKFESMFIVLARAVKNIVIALICVVFVFLVGNTALYGKIGSILGLPDTVNKNLLMFNLNWGSNRGTTWLAGLRVFIEQNWLHKFVGVGPDCMAEYIYNNASEELVEMIKVVFGNSKLTNAHNEWLTMLVNEGILGFVAFVGMIISAVKRFIYFDIDKVNKSNKGNERNNGNEGNKWNKDSRSGEKSWGEIVLIYACGFGILAYTVNNIFSFQQAMATPTMFVVLGIGECLVREK